MMKNKKKKGFTLIEMVAVVAIIGILAAILVPKITGYMKEAKKTEVIDQARKVSQAYETAVMKGKIKEKTDAGVDTATTIYTNSITDATMLSLLDVEDDEEAVELLDKIQGVTKDGADGEAVSVRNCIDIVKGTEFNVTSDGKLITAEIKPVNPPGGQ